MTNEDYIKSLTTEELAEWILKHTCCPWCPARVGCKELTNEDCLEHIAEWLKRTAPKALW